MIKKHPQSLLLFLLLSWSAPALASYNATTHTYEWTDDLSSLGEYTGGLSASEQQRPKVQTKARHMLEMKDAIDNSFTLCGGTSSVWDAYDLSVLSGIQKDGKVTKEQSNTLRKGIRALYALKSQTPPTSIAQLDPNIPIRIQKSHIQDMRDALNTITGICAAGGAPRTPVCWTLSGPECDIYAQPGCSNARMCGVYSYSDGSQETDMAPCDAPPNGPPPGWSVCGGGSYCWSNKGVSQPPGCVGTPFDVGLSFGVGSCQTPGACVYVHHPPEDGTGLGSFDEWYQCGDCNGPSCGNGIIESGEQCDDHNTANGDGCSSTCQTETCLSEGAMCIGVYEACGPAAQSICDSSCCSGAGMLSYEMGYCSGVCVSNTGSSPICGNGVKEGAEQCDDGNSTDGDGCSSTCQNETRGCLPPGTVCLNNCGQMGDCTFFCDQCCYGYTTASGWMVCASAGPVCGDGACNNGEDCNTCAGDCGACPSGGGGGPAPYCGDGVCNGTDDCNTCPGDCGICGCG